jgi:hypothetical protein
VKLSGQFRLARNEIDESLSEKLGALISASVLDALGEPSLGLFD